MKSKHLIQEDGKAHAVDLMHKTDRPVGKSVYDEIADSTKHKL